MISIVDYGVCNVGSLRNMLKKIGVSCQISKDPEIVSQADKLILPGVGSFDAGMARLRDTGLDGAIIHAAVNRKVPALGICLGMQLMCRSSEEGKLPGLDLMNADVRKFVRKHECLDLRIPHMGWNTVSAIRNHSLFRELETNNRFYFVHSYHVVCDDPSDVVGQTEYGGTFTSCFAHENLLGVQFHPEKSNRFGMKMLQNFGSL